MKRTIYIDIVDEDATEIETVALKNNVFMTTRPPARDRGKAFVKLDSDGEPYTQRDWHYFILFDQNFIDRYASGDAEGSGHREATERERMLGEWYDRDDVGRNGELRNHESE